MSMDRRVDRIDFCTNFFTRSLLYKFMYFYNVPFENDSDYKSLSWIQTKEDNPSKCYRKNDSPKLKVGRMRPALKKK